MDEGVALAEGDGERGDLHGNLAALTHVLDFFRAHGVGRGHNLAHERVVGDDDFIDQGVEGQARALGFDQMPERGRVVRAGGAAKDEGGGVAAKDAAEHND